jgi:hypothetical protein
VQVLQLIAQDPQVGGNSGLGLIHQFINHPDALRVDPQRGSGRQQAITAVATQLQVSAEGAALDLNALYVGIRGACSIPTQVITGRPHTGNGYENEASMLCYAALGVLRAEQTGAPFDQNRDRNWADGISVGPAFVTGELGTIIDRALEALGFKGNTLGTGSSLNALANLADSQVRACKQGLEALSSAGCG